ncbi:aromatic alcohol reductase [Pedobacter cryoconitis]|uniref:NmrA-like domain-containing protein n=1 Tax=Pedobacter cryoconitis TaxID=188932 RepID=A0A7X0J2X4_9SPHI|nr:aromatic alcohol reductase [Pedobacter cryoconitis]MBB6498807.1 hypothetical protein [Pedobacter cryoconitis]
MHNTSILVLGAGELGMPVLRNLAKQALRFSGTTITVLLRPSTIDSHNADKQRTIAEIKSLGIHILSGDLSASTTELSTIFKDFHTVISCTGYVTGSGGFQLKLSHAVLNAGVKRYFPWQFGVDYDLIGRGSAQDLFDEQMDVRDLLRSQNQTEWVIVSTGMFTSFLFEPSFGIVNLAENTVHALGSWDTAVTVTTPEDIGRLTAEICFAEPRIVDNVVYTAGDTITYKELADTIDAVSGRKVQRIDWSLPELEDELLKDPDNAIKKYRLAFAGGKGVAWDQSKTFNAQQQIETMDVRQWAQENLS